MISLSKACALLLFTLAFFVSQLPILYGFSL